MWEHEQEPRDIAGVASLTAAVLAEGTERLDAGALAEEFERLGGSLSSYATWGRNARPHHRFIQPARKRPVVVERSGPQARLAPREVDRLKEERLAELLELKKRTARPGR
jgi:hypothetical protein